MCRFPAFGRKVTSVATFVTIDMGVQIHFCDPRSRGDAGATGRSMNHSVSTVEVRIPFSGHTTETDSRFVGQLCAYELSASAVAFVWTLYASGLDGTNHGVLSVEREERRELEQPSRNTHRPSKIAFRHFVGLSKRLRISGASEMVGSIYDRPVSIELRPVIVTARTPRWTTGTTGWDGIATVISATPRLMVGGSAGSRKTGSTGAFATQRSSCAPAITEAAT